MEPEDECEDLDAELVECKLTTLEGQIDPSSGEGYEQQSAAAVKIQSIVRGNCVRTQLTRDASDLMTPEQQAEALGAMSGADRSQKLAAMSSKARAAMLRAMSPACSRILTSSLLTISLTPEQKAATMLAGNCPSCTAVPL